MVINGAQETFTGRDSFTCGFHCCGNFTGRAHGRMNTPKKLRTVSLRNVNSLTCIALFFFWGGGKPAPQTPPLLDGNTVTVATKCYEDNCHYVALIRIKCELSTSV